MPDVTLTVNLTPVLGKKVLYETFTAHMKELSWAHVTAHSTYRASFEDGLTHAQMIATTRHDIEAVKNKAHIASYKGDIVFNSPHKILG